MINGLRKKSKKYHPLQQPQIKYPGVTLIKQMKDLYDKNLKSLRKEIEEDTRKRRDLPCSWMGRINILKVAILPKAIYRFNSILIEIPVNSSQTSKG